MEHGMADRQWIEYGRLLQQVHRTVLPPDLARIMQRESFTPAGSGAVRRLDAHIGERAYADPAAGALATFWQARRAEIRALLERAEDLGQRLARAAPAFVLCHADVHTANVLLDADQRVWIADWDETILAPVERDLMFVVGGISSDLVGPREEALFFRGYGQGYGVSTVDPLALAYYRYAWAVGDIGAYGEEVFCRPDLGPISRRAAVDQFSRLFAPGNIVTLAFATDASTG
jgi:spectinomycin phosphotransferase